MKNLLEKAIYAELNKDPMADTFIHQYLVSRSAQINEALRKGKEFVMEDLEGPSIPDIELQETDLLLDTPEDTDSDDDGDEDGDFVLDDGYDVDTDGDGEISDEEEIAALEHMRAAIDELEKMYEKDSEEDEDEDEDEVPAKPVAKAAPAVAESRRARKVRESTIVTRDPDGKIEIEFNDDGSQATSVSADPVASPATPAAPMPDADTGEDDGMDTSAESDDTSDLGADDSEDEMPTVESRQLARSRVIEGRKARQATLAKTQAKTVKKK